MKTYFFNFRMMFLALGAVMMLGLSSCDKDAEGIATPQGSEVNFRSDDERGDGDIDYSVVESSLSQINYSAISVNAELGMLQFASDDDLGRTLELLEEADNALDEEINNSFIGFTEDELDAVDFNDEHAFERFEDNFSGFTTFRANASAEIEEFFSQEELDDENDPSDVYGAIPDVLGAVLNVNGEVMSSDGSVLPTQVHIARLDGGNYSVLDADEETVMAIRNGMDHSDIAGLENVKIVNDPTEVAAMGMTRCDSNHTRKSTKYIYQSGSKKYRAKLQVRIRNFSFLWWNIHRASSQLKSRKKSGWWWKKHRTTIGITQRGNVYKSTYTYYPCIKYYYDEFLEEWVPYEDICVRENKCDGDALSAYTSGSKYTWKYKRERNYSTTVSASNKDGVPGTLRTTFTWKGQTYNLSIF